MTINIGQARYDTTHVQARGQTAFFAAKVHQAPED